MIFSGLVLLGFLTGYVWPIAPQNQQHPVTGTFGEFRSGPPPHFHNGTDILAPEGTPVYAVASGEVLWLGSGANGGVRVGRFAYVHVVPRADLQYGDYVAQGELVGYTNQLNHVHFKDGGGASSLPERNALMPDDGLEPFEDPYHPAIVSLHFFSDNISYQLDPHHLSGMVDIVAKAYDTTDMNPYGINNGVFRIGYALLSADTSQFIFEPHFPFEFEHIPSNAYIGNVFYVDWSNNSNHYYIVTNEVEYSSALDLRQLEPGNYVVAVYAEDTRNNMDTLYFDITVTESDTTPPSPPVFKSVTVDENGYATVSWHPVNDSDLAGYKLYLKFNDSPWQEWETFGPDELSYSFSMPFPEGWRFYLRLTSFDDESPPNESGFSETFVAMHAGADRPHVALVYGLGEPDSALMFALDGLEDVNVASFSDSSICDSLMNYHAAFFFYGNDVQPFVCGLPLVQDFVCDGHKLALFGNDAVRNIVSMPGGDDFLERTLEIEFVFDSVDADSVFGIAGMPLEDLRFAVSGDNDAIAAISSSFALLRYDNGVDAGVLDDLEHPGAITFPFTWHEVEPETVRVSLVARTAQLFGLMSVREQVSGGPLKPNVVLEWRDGTLLVRSSTDMSVRMGIFDAAGRRIVSRIARLHAGVNLFNIRKLPSGVYFVRFTDGRKLDLTKRILVVRR